MTLGKKVDEMVEELYVDHLEDLIRKADMAVRFRVKDKEAYYERLRVGSRRLLRAIRKALTSSYKQGVRDTEKRIEKVFDGFLLEDWSGEAEVYEEIERLKLQALKNN